MRKFIKKNQDGQALVEFALILPILLILLLGIVEFGQIFFSYMVIQTASRDGARYGTMWASETEIVQAIQNNTNTLDGTNLTISISPEPSLRKHGKPLKVAIEYQVPLITPFWKNILPNPFPISAETVMRIE